MKHGAKNAQIQGKYLTITWRFMPSFMPSQPLRFIRAKKAQDRVSRPFLTSYIPMTSWSSRYVSLLTLILKGEGMT